MDFDSKKVNTHPIGPDNQYGGDVCQVTSTPDCSIILVGVPSTQSFCAFHLNKANLQLTLHKRIIVDGFKTFEMDRHATQVVFLNSRCRVLDFYSLKWEFEVKGSATKDYEKLDEAAIEEQIKPFLAQLAQGAGAKGRFGEKADPLGAELGGSHKTACCSIF